MRDVGNLIAHLFTPWAWRSRHAVQALAAVGLGLLVWAAYAGWQAGEDPANTAVHITIRVVLTLALITYPAVRSLRRWESLHAPDSRQL